MAPKPQWIDPATGEAPAGLVFTGLVPGTPSPARPLELWNDRDAAGADVLRHLRVVALARRSVGEDFVAEGLPVLDTRAVQLRVTGGLGGLTPAPTGWRPFGAGAFLDLPPLPAGTGFALELRVALAPGASSDAVTVRLRLDSRRSVPLARGVFEVAGSGVLHGLGDRTRSHLLHLGGPVEADGTDSVTLPDVVWIHRGRPWARWTAPLTLDAFDGDGQPLAADQVAGRHRGRRRHRRARPAPLARRPRADGGPHPSRARRRRRRRVGSRGRAAPRSPAGRHPPRPSRRTSRARPHRRRLGPRPREPRTRRRVDVALSERRPPRRRGRGVALAEIKAETGMLADELARVLEVFASVDRLEEKILQWWDED